MVMVTEQHQPCWHYPAWNLPDSNHLEPMHHTNLPSSFNSHVFTANAVSQGISGLVPGSPYSRTNELVGVHGVLQPIPTHMNESQSALLHGIGRKAVPTSACDSTGKRFLIFDHSGDQTRLFFSPSFPPHQNEVLSRKTFGDNGLGHGKLRALVEHRSPRELIIQEQLDRSYSYGSERPEDTEEIDALLYSDGDSEDDEVTSTGHSPFPVQGGCHEHAQFGELASSDGSSKRQRLHDGGYMNSSLKDTASSVQLRRSHRYDDDIGSSCVKGTEFKGEEQSPHSHASQKKAKIHEMLKTLETMIPGLKSKDPLSVFDEAIDYLKHLRLKAKELGLEPTPVPLEVVSGAVVAEKKWGENLDCVFPRNDYF
ncbi:PREDICTED: transcription factor SAC51-like [Ipomoea nil]|uniref:transcription factor SAC51-like n=1 Tax=Ipomoea nil TaxID=35883 RepID=UPI0009009707|nr:PREDICTED: transcription factor SAC51-like [Ipomoea nil]